MACGPKEAGVYRPRHPQQSPFYQLVERFFPQFQAAYEKRYQERYGFWRPIIGTVVRKFSWRLPGGGGRVVRAASFGRKALVRVLNTNSATSGFLLPCGPATFSTRMPCCSMNCRSSFSALSPSDLADRWRQGLSRSWSK